MYSPYEKVETTEKIVATIGRRKVVFDQKRDHNTTNISLETNYVR